MPTQPFASVADTVNVKLPVSTGLPESSPEAESVSPSGSAPEVTAKVVGAVAPGTASCCAA